MVLGDTMSVLLQLEVDISQLSKLATARRAISRFEKRTKEAGRAGKRGMSPMNRSMGQAAMTAGMVSGELSGVASMAIETGSAGQSMGSKFSNAMGRARTGVSSVTRGIMQMIGGLKGARKALFAMRMAALNVMFTGLNLLFIFGLLLAQSPRVRAGFTAIASALKVISQEAGKTLLPHLLNLAKAIRNTDKETRKLYGNILIWGSAIGLILLVLGILGGAIGTIISGLITFGAVIASILGFIGGLIGISAAAVAGFIAILVGGFLLGMKMVNKFGDVLTAVFIGIIAIIAIIILAFVSVPAMILTAMVAVFGIFFLLKEEIAKFATDSIKALTKFGNYIINQLPSDIMKGLNSIKNTITTQAPKIIDEAAKLGEDIVDGIADAILDASGEIADAVKDAIPSDIDLPDMKFGGNGDDSGGGGGGFLKLNDFVVTDSGKVIKPHRDDTLIGTKNPEALGGGGNVTVNFNEPQIDSEVDIDRLMDEVEDRLERNQRRQNNLL